MEAAEWDGFWGWERRRCDCLIEGKTSEQAQLDHCECSADYISRYIQLFVSTRFACMSFLES